MQRRTFLKAAGVAGAAAGMGFKVRSASAKALFGDTPAAYASMMLPKANQASSILECFLYGGPCPWESFYCVPEFGSLSSRTWAQAYPVDLANAVAGCGYDPDPSKLFTPFANDSSGRLIYLGPYLKPLLARSDMTDRMRVVVNRHTFETTEAAVPLTMTGRVLGSASLAGLGAHVARYFGDHDVDHEHATPFAYGISRGNSFIPTDNIYSMLATGLHPGFARPLQIKIDNASRLTALLSRGSVGSLDQRAAYDVLIAIYNEQYQSRLRFGGAGSPLRAPRFDEYIGGSDSLAHAADIQAMFPAADYLTAVPGTACHVRSGGQVPDTSTTGGAVNSSTINTTAMGLKLAVHLLTDPSASVKQAKHCVVVDSGLKEADGGGGYGTHNETPFTQAENFYNFFTSLLPLVNAPGESDPNKLDLNKTMIILNMEFGRAPGLQTGHNTGRNNWPFGYAQVYFGGPITTAQRGVYGAIAEDGMATTYTTPTENRVAALLAMGIWPFNEAGFNEADVRNASDPGAAAQAVTSNVLGYSV